MLLLLAFVAFLIGLIVRIVNSGFEFEDVWLWLLLGLVLWAAHALWALPLPWNNRRAP